MIRFPRRQTLACVMAVVLVATAMPALLLAQVLEQVPADALVVVKVKNLKATSAKIGKMLQDYGIAAMQPGLDDPLTFLMQRANVKQGVDTSGDMAFVYRDPSVVKESDDKSMMALVPVSDYKAFLTNFPGAKTEGEISEVRFGGPADPDDADVEPATQPGGDADDKPARAKRSGPPVFVAQWGKFAALSPSKIILSAKPTAMLKITGAATLKELDAKDMVLMGNFQQLRKLLVPKLQENKEKILAEVEQGVMREEKAARYAPAIKAAVNQGLVVAEAFLNDCDAASFGVNFGAEGLNTTVMADFRPDSYAGTIAKSTKLTDGPLLQGLPSGKYLLYGGSVGQPSTFCKVVDDFSAPILKELNALGPEMKPVDDYFAALKAFAQTMTGGQIGIVAPAGNLGQEAIFQMLMVNRGDAAAMKTAYQNMIVAQEKAMQAFGLPAEAFKATVTPAAKTIDGVPFDVISTTMNADPSNPQARAHADMLGMIYGPEGMSMSMGAVSKDVLIMTSGVPDPMIVSTIAAAKAGDAPLAKLTPVQQVAANLPKSRCMEFYFPIDTIATTVASYAGKLGAGTPDFRLPDDLPPIGMTVSTDGAAFRTDTYIPTSLVQAMVSATMQVMMQMQGGNRPGGAGGL